MKYLYETHLHTVEASACSDTPGKRYIDHMKKIGYSGIIVTDHFFNGNCSIPRDMTWEDRVELYCKGYEHAYEEAKGTDFKVFFGVEFNFRGDEYLLYGIDKEWLLRNPEIMDMSRKELHLAVNAAGGIMIQAHPYRERGYLSAVRLAPEDVDGAECFNAENPDWQNSLGYQYCLKHNFIMSSGSDIHHLTQKHMGAMSFPYEINSIQDYVKAFLAGDGTPMFVRDIDEEGFEFRPVAEEPLLVNVTQGPTLPVEVY